MAEDQEPENNIGEGEESSARLDGLEGLQDLFQLDAFIKAAQKGGTGLSSFFKKSKKDPNSAGDFTLEDLLTFSSEPIPTSLLKLSGDHVSRAVKMFSGILKYQGETGEKLDTPQKIDIAQKLLHQGLKRPELKDELYMQLVKQTHGDPTENSRLKAWELLQLVAATMPPSKDFVGLVSEYIHGVAQDEAEDAQVRNMASRTWNCLKRSAKAGPRRTLPSNVEIEALFDDSKLNTIVFFLDETFEELTYDVTGTVLEAVEQLAGIIKLQNYNTFTLFECRRAVSKQQQASGGGAIGGAIEPQADEHMLLDDNRYIADVMCEFKNSKLAKDGYQSKLLFKKRMFRETDETITEAQFINLSYVQAQHDYLQGNYPVVREDAAQMCALQMQAEHAAMLIDNEESIMRCIETYVTKQVLMTRPREEWGTDVTARYRALEQFSKEDARLQFLRILRSLPYGNSIFFAVKRIEDPIGLLPAKLILGINKRGVHFFRPVPKEYLHSAELRDIMQFGSSSTAVFFKMRVAGVLHIFQFETRQGEDICMALQTHINDIMMKRYSKAKAMTGDGNMTSAGGAGGPLGLTQANFGPKYEQHVASLQKSLEEAQERMQQMQKTEDALKYEKEQIASDLDEVNEQLSREEDGKSTLSDRLGAITRDLENTKTELALARAAGAAGGAMAAASIAGGEDTDERVAELESLMESRLAELVEANEKLVVLEKRSGQLLKEKELIDKKMQRIEKAKEQETKELRDKLELSQGDVRIQLKNKDDKVTEITEELSNINLLYVGVKADLEQSKADGEELGELRELKEDVERKEKQQAMIIENQAKRLEELEKLFKDEQVARKRYFNMMEDMKGKIRVFCRVRPPLNSEGTDVALSMPDELTIIHAASDGSQKEYGFDQVFHPGLGQDKVFDSTKALLQSAVNGYNVCVMAYGQTGSGKTYTIYGTPEEPGLAPRSVNEIIRITTRDATKFSFVVTVTMLELYRDQLVDLLVASPTGAKMEIKKDARTGFVTVLGANSVEVSSADELKKAIAAGDGRRRAGAESSKSHAIIAISIEATNLQTQNVTKGKLSLVDLAGSERVSGPSGADAKFINKSLSALSSVINALANEQASVPYRDHKLTMLLSDSLGGNAKTQIFINAIPTAANLTETENSLMYGTNARAIKNESTKNELNKEMLKLKKAVDHWKEQAGLTPEQRSRVDLMPIQNIRQIGEE